MNNRRRFLKTTATLGAALAMRPLVAQATAAPEAPKIPERPPALDRELVKTFVIAAHGDLVKTQTLLGEQAHLINSTWDWGGGDFETALGGASHMGRRDIALFLLEKGARLDLFAAAMLGRLDVVRPLLENYPYMLRTPGPHGIPLLVHAQKGGAEAAETLAYLQGLKSQTP